MYEEINALEEQLNNLLPAKRKIEIRLSQNLHLAAIKWSEAVWEKAKELGAQPIDENKVYQALDFSNHPVFICGTHRSGTTLLRDLLDGHPRLSVIPSEGTFLTNQHKQLLQLPYNEHCAHMCKEWLRRLANPINQAPYWLLGRTTQGESSYVEFARTFITWWNFFVNKKDEAQNEFLPFIVLQLAFSFSLNKSAELKYKYWVDKTPGNENYLSKIWRQFPEAKIIHIVRNPADILASIKQIQAHLSLRNSIRGIHKSFKIAARHQTKYSERYLVIRYEDLCNDQITTTQLLAAFLNIEWLPCLLQPSVASRPTQANSSFTDQTEYGKILTFANQREEKRLNPKELKLLSAAVEKFAPKFGYTLPQVNVWEKVYLKTIYRFW